MKKDTTAKLAACEASIKRWNARLTRAVNALRKLDRERRRLQAKMGPVNLTDLIGKPFSAKDVGADQEPVRRTLADRPRTNAHMGVVTDKPFGTLPSEPLPLAHHDDLGVVAEAVKIVKESGLELPEFLDRQKNPQPKAPPQLVDQLKAKRTSAVEADKKKMPLTGRAALDAIKPKRKAKAS